MCVCVCVSVCLCVCVCVSVCLCVCYNRATMVLQVVLECDTEHATSLVGARIVKGKALLRQPPLHSGAQASLLAIKEGGEEGDSVSVCMCMYVVFLCLCLSPHPLLSLRSGCTHSLGVTKMSVLAVMTRACNHKHNLMLAACLCTLKKHI